MSDETIDLQDRLAVALRAILISIRKATRENRPLSVEDALTWPDVLGLLREAGYSVEGASDD